MDVRLASPREAPLVADMLRKAFAEYRHEYTPRAFALTMPTSQEVFDRWREGPVWLAHIESGPAGTLSAVPGGLGLYLRSMAVLPRARGWGIGWALLDKAEQYALRLGCGRMFLSTTPFLLPAIRLYSRFGFVRTGEGPDDLAGTPLYTMEKRLLP
jgi:GNAT superfamily N-acetyltransferase